MIKFQLNIELQYPLFISIVTLLLLYSPVSLISQSINVPPEIHFPLLLKVLSFDRNINKNGDDVVIGIVYQSKYRNSLELKNELIEIAGSGTKINNKKIKIEAIDVSSLEDIETRIKKETINYLYLTPLRALSIARISEITKKYSIVTISGVSEYVYDGISLGIDLKNSRPSIIINLRSALKEGADFDSQLMRIARIVDDEK